MITVRRLLAVCLAVLFAVPAHAQSHVISKAALDKAVLERSAREQADREAIVSFLHRADVRQIAAKAGLSIDKAETAVAMLGAQDLEWIAGQARHVQNDLAGGASTITISTTTIIIALLIVILIVLIAD